MKKYKYLFWDLDGTLTDSLPGIANGLDLLFARYDMDIPKEKYRYFVGPPLTSSFGHFFKDKDTLDEALKYFREYYLERGIYEATVYDGIPSALQFLRGRGYKNFIATSKRETAAIAVVKDLGLYEYFDGIFGADDTKGIVEKEQVLENVFLTYPNIDKADCVMIGDTMYDARGAEIVGVDYFAALYGFGDTDELLAAHPVGSVKCPKEYLDYFK